MARKASTSKTEVTEAVSEAVKKLNEVSGKVESSFIEVGRLMLEAVKNKGEKTQKQIFKGIVESQELRISPSMVYRAFYTVKRFPALLGTPLRMSISNYELLAKKGAKLGGGVMVQIESDAVSEKLSYRALDKRIKDAKMELRPERTKLEALLVECHKALRGIKTEALAKEVLKYLTFKTEGKE